MTVNRLQRIRTELAVILRHRAPVDLPAAFSAIAHGRTDERLDAIDSRTDQATDR